MAQVTITVSGLTKAQAEAKAKVLQEIDQSLSAKEIETLGKIAKSKTAKDYLTGSKFIMLKTFLKLK